MDNRAATREVINTYKRKRLRNSSGGLERKNDDDGELKSKHPKNGCLIATSRDLKDHDDVPLILILESKTRLATSGGEHPTEKTSMTTYTTTTIQEEEVEKQFVELVNQGSIREEQLQHGVRDTLAQTQASQAVDEIDVEPKVEVASVAEEIRQLKETTGVLSSQLEKSKAVQDYNSEKVISRGTNKMAGKKKVAANQHSQMSNGRAPPKNMTSGPSRVFALDSTRHTTFSHRVSHPLCPTPGNVVSNRVINRMFRSVQQKGFCWKVSVS